MSVSFLFFLFFLFSSSSSFFFCFFFFCFFRLHLVINFSSLQVDNGKSTIGGHLMVQLGSVSERQLEKLQTSAREAGREGHRFAWALDKRPQERERGITVDMKVACFRTPRYEVSLIDTPGHEDFLKNMIAGTSQADAALLVVSADAAELEAGLSEHGLTREHALLAYTVGIKQLIVVVNKMDLCGYAEEAFKAAVEKVSAMLKKIGYPPKAVAFVPVSGYEGDNLSRPSTKVE